MWVYLAPLFNNSNLFSATLALCNLEHQEYREFLTHWWVKKKNHPFFSHRMGNLWPFSTAHSEDMTVTRMCSSFQICYFWFRLQAHMKHPQSWSWRQLHLIQLLAPMFSSPTLKPTQHISAFTSSITIKTKLLFAVDVIPTQSSTFLCPVTHSNFTSGVRLMCWEIIWTCLNLWKVKSIFSNIFSCTNISSRAVIFMPSVTARWLYMVKLQLFKMWIYNTDNGSPTTVTFQTCHL